MKMNFHFYLSGFIRCLRILGIFPYSVKKSFWFVDMKGENLVRYRKKLFVYHSSLFWRFWSYLFLLLLTCLEIWKFCFQNPLASFLDDKTKTLKFSTNLMDLISFVSMFAFYVLYLRKQSLLAYILNYGEMMKHELKLKKKDFKTCKLIHFIIWIILPSQIIVILLSFFHFQRQYSIGFTKYFSLLTTKYVIIMIGTGLSIIFHFLLEEITLFYEVIFSRLMISSENVRKDHAKCIFRYLEMTNHFHHFKKKEKESLNISKDKFASFLSFPSKVNNLFSPPIISKNYISYCQKCLQQIYHYQNIINDCFGSFIIFLLTNIILSLIISIFFSCVPNIPIIERFISITFSFMPLSQLACIIDSAYNVQVMRKKIHQSLRNVNNSESCIELKDEVSIN
ncbi:UNVERIFIED_CONTAM: hypothetical protein RMT77_007152 [Armadillidium vulgare]